MSIAEQPHHVSEWYPFPKTNADLIFDELQYGGRGSQLREVFDRELRAMYEPTPLGKSLLEFPVSLTVARAYDNADNERFDAYEAVSRSHAVSLGILLGMHAELRQGNPEISRQITFSSFRVRPPRAKSAVIPDWPNQEKMHESVLALESSYLEILEAYDEDLQEAIVTASIAAYMDYPDRHMAMRFEDDFCFGYVYAKLGIDFFHESTEARRAINNRSLGR